MDADLIFTLSLLLVVVSIGAHFLGYRSLSRSLGEHLAASHEDGWRRAGGSRLDGAASGTQRADELSDYAAWRWVRAQVRRGTECERCLRMARSGKLLIASVASTTLLLLAIAEIWGR